MPVSMVVLASKPTDWTQERFTTWWRGPHADAARLLPGLRAYRHGAVTRDYDNPDVPAWDGHAVLTFADQAAVDAALGSPEWAAAIAQTRGMGGRRIVLLTDEVDLLAGAPHG
jgi:uncharacterized protein (TIGR02118 family)